MTVKELKEILSKYDDDMKTCIKRDGDPDLQMEIEVRHVDALDEYSGIFVHRTHLPGEQMLCFA